MFKNYLDLQAEYLRSQRKKRKKSDKQKKSDKFRILFYLFAFKVKKLV